jgi:hypothetical protein
MRCNSDARMITKVMKVVNDSIVALTLTCRMSKQEFKSPFPGQPDGLPIVVQVGPPAAVQDITTHSNARLASLPGAGPAPGLPGLSKILPRYTPLRLIEQLIYSADSFPSQREIDLLKQVPFSLRLKTEVEKPHFLRKP